MNDQSINFIDNSTLSAVKRCPLHAHYRYEMHWSPMDRPIYFDFGTAWHTMQDAVWPAICWDHVSQDEVYQRGCAAFDAKWTELGLDPNPSQAIAEEWAPRTPGIAREMLKNYISVRYDWLRYKIQLLAVEQPFVVPLDPDDPTLFYIGRLDKVLMDGDEVVAGEHKTTTVYRIAGDHFASQWIESFDPNSQIDGYNHGLKMHYRNKVKGVLVDGAMVHKKVHDAFRFIPSYRSTHQLEAWRQETLYWARAWLRFIKTGFMPRNTNGCVNQYHKTCEYISTCRQYNRAIHDLEPPRGMKVEKWEPYDLSILHKAAQEALND